MRRMRIDDDHAEGEVKGEKAEDDADFVGACAVEMHVKISQEPLYTEIYK